MNTEISISSRIESIVGDNVSAFARESGIGESLLRQYIAGSKPGLEKAAAIAKTGNVTLEWLATGVGDRSPVVYGVNESNGVYVPIPRHTRLEDGNEIDIESEIASLSLSSKWLKQKGLEPKNMVYTRMPDDSMEPKILEGDLVVIDASTDKLRGDGLYALMYKGMPTVKRLHLEYSGDLFILNDNDIYKSERINSENVATVSVIGKVIWIGGEV